MNNLFTKKDFSDVKPGVVRIRRYTHYFVVDGISPKFLQFIYAFSKDYTEFQPRWDWKTRRNTFEPKKTFVLRLNKGEEFRFHRGQWWDFADRLKRSNIYPHEYKILDIGPPKPDKISFKIKPEFKPREDQPEVIAHVLKENDPLAYSRTVTMRTGGGKTFTAFWCASKLKVRFAIIVLAMYLDKWVEDIKKYTDIKDDEIGIIKGNKILQRTTLYPGSHKKTPKVFVISISTLQPWYKLHEEDTSHPGLADYECMPDEFFPHMGIGFTIFDEAHQHPYAIYRVQCYMQVQKSLQLTATLLTKNESLKRIQSAMFPVASRFAGDAIEPYMRVRTNLIKVPDWNHCPLKEKYFLQNNYNHGVFEESLMKYRVMFENYKEMVLDYIQNTYLKTYVPGDRMLLFVSRIETADAFCKAIKRQWPRFDTRTYTQNDPYKNLMEADISVSTVLSAGTAHDIENLRHAYLLQNLDSPNAVAQAMGRLRDLKKTRKENNDVFFHFFVFTDIEKHMLYMENRKPLVNQRSRDQAVSDIGMLEWKKPEMYDETYHRRERLQAFKEHSNRLKPKPEKNHERNYAYTGSD